MNFLLLTILRKFQVSPNISSHASQSTDRARIDRARRPFSREKAIRVVKRRKVQFYYAAVGTESHGGNSHLVISFAAGQCGIRESREISICLYII